jgi:hypothetical protein
LELQQRSLEKMNLRVDLKQECFAQPSRRKTWRIRKGLLNWLSKLPKFAVLQVGYPSVLMAPGWHRWLLEETNWVAEYKVGTMWHQM